MEQSYRAFQRSLYPFVISKVNLPHYIVSLSSLKSKLLVCTILNLNQDISNPLPQHKFQKSEIHNEQLFIRTVIILCAVFRLFLSEIPHTINFIKIINLN